jgi:P4 family phage/plasmid primase-like protien
MPSASKLNDLLGKYQGNAYPAMLADLGQHLGVSTEALSRLALGWAPIVPFKKGPNYQGWWVIPERDASGGVLGLSLRSQNDVKVMYPGSKHGLIYEINPKHEQGGLAYQRGAHNWTRTMDAGLLCPICGKPDGCLLSSENPADPKAVVCIREKSSRTSGMGYLHIRKPEGDVSPEAPVLAPSDYPVIIVEGMSDTAAMMGLGFVTVGRPSNLAGLDELKELVRGRSVVIIGENDQKADGKWPGKEGMEATAQILRGVCKGVKMVMPPEHVKDARAWVVKYGLTREKFLAHVEKHGAEHAEGVILPDDLYATIASCYLNAAHKAAGRYLLRHWEDNWWRFCGGKYVKQCEAEFEQPLLLWADGKKVQRETAKGPTFESLNFGSSLIRDVARHIRKLTLIVSKEIPCWLNGVEDTEDPRNLVVFTNGLLNVPAFIRSENTEELQPGTPDFFTPVAIPYPFDPSATCPLWLKFLGEVFAGSDCQQKIDLLQEWFGYCMVPDTTMQKMMFLRGPSAAGKSVILNILCQIVGVEQAASTSFSSLAKDFGLQPLVGALVCVIPDARISANADVMRGLETLLSITSGEGQQINRKFLDALKQLRLFVRVSIASNEFLDLPDTAGAMLRRLNILEFSHSFVGREDWQLEDKLKIEIPGIAVWALRGLKRLRERKVFTLPESSKMALGDWRTSTNPLASFIEECCEVKDGTRVSKSELFDAWTNWCAERRIKPITKSRFYERVKSTAPFAHSMALEYRGLALTSRAKCQYLGKPV